MAGLAGRIGRGLRSFLEIIGLRRGDLVEREAQLARFRQYHMAFRRLLQANDSFLSVLSGMDAKRRGGGGFDAAWVRRQAVRAVADVHGMVESLREIAPGRYPGLREAADSITAEVSGMLGEEDAPAVRDLVIDLAALRASHADVAGPKMANLGEVRNGVGLPTPDGFAVTTEGFRAMADSTDLGARILAEHMNLASPADADRVAAALTGAIAGTPVPEALAAGILAAFDRLAARAGGEVRVAVRSSAPGEDTGLSFAGQYRTELNVPRSGLVDAYRSVLASLYCREAVHYRLLHGVPGESASMAVGVVAMVDATAAGIAFSRDPARPEAGEALIQCVRGLGVALADGDAAAEEIRVGPESGPPTIVRLISGQASRTVCDSGGGVREQAIAGKAPAGHCLSDEDARCLAAWIRRLEAHFGGPQDVEWASAGAGQPCVLQSRPLRLSARAVSPEGPVPGARILITGGEAACPGVGSGPAVHCDADGALDAFPEGGVLVARRSSPRFIRVMARARAIVADAGSVTGHMASLARELGVPTLLNMGAATRAIPHGDIVTVDAAGGIVYAGAVEVPGRGAVRGAAAGPGPRGTAAHVLLDRVASKVIPLHLHDPGSPDFTPRGCSTLHDLARFVHEQSFVEMFGLGEQQGDFRSAAFLLDVFLPLDLYVVDLGGGVRPPARGRRIRQSDVASAPLAALLRGILDPRIPRFGPRALDARGLAGVMIRHALTSPERERTFRDPSYALVSDTYVNYTSRVGYHFGVVDSYCCDATNRNYVNLRFQGGAADEERRARRVRAIGGVLTEEGFSVQVEGDRVDARIAKAPRDETERQLETVGRLFQYFRQMDVAMTSDAAADRFRDAFLKGDLGCAGGGQPPPG